MKKFLLLWVVVCLVVILLPKTIDRFTPKTVIVYKDLKNKVFRIQKIADYPNEAYRIEFIKNFPGGCMVWGGHDGKRDFYLTVSYEKGHNHEHPIPELREKKKQETIITYPQNYGSRVTSSVVGFIERD